MVHGNQLSIPTDLRELYWGEGYTLDEIADEYSVDILTVRSWFEKEDIKTRDKNSKFYLPFSGDVDDVQTLLTNRDDLFIRCVVHGGGTSYNVYKEDGTLKALKPSDPPRAVTEQYVQSLLDSYDTRLCYKDDYGSFDP